MRALPLLLALTVCACDSSEKEYRSALMKYEALIVAKKPVHDSAYDAVLAQLDEIKTGDAAPRAKQLAEAIRTLRKPKELPPRPLAVVTADSDDPVEQKAQECARLAMAVGTAPFARRAEAMTKLAECRKEHERLDVARIHAQDPLGHSDDAGAH